MGPTRLQLTKPVIAAVDGPAFGAGLSLALAADFVLATRRAKFCAVFGRIGLVPDLGALHLLPRIVGQQKAKELVFTARRVSGDEAQAVAAFYLEGDTAKVRCQRSGRAITVAVKLE